MLSVSASTRSAMDITNKTQRPLRVSLPGGKKLFLGPGRTGQITPKAAEHPPVKALIEAGELEIQVGAGHRASGATTSSKGPATGDAHGGGSGVRQSGDR